MKTLSIFLLLLFTPIANAQEKPEYQDISFESVVFSGERKLSVYLPAAYFKEDAPSRFATVYLFDGQFEPYLSMVSSMISYYAQTGEGISLIVVGIHTDQRWGEFVPLPEQSGQEKEGGAAQLSQFLAQEAIPLIDSLYRTSDYRIGVGHSLGGTFVLQELFRDNSLFNAVIAVSPNLTMYGEQIVHQAEAWYQRTPESMRFAYCTAGTEWDMERDFQKSLLHLDSITRLKAPSGMTWQCRILPGQNHMTTFVPTFNDAYLVLSGKLMLLNDELVRLAEDPIYPVAEDLRNFYAHLSTFCGREEQLSPDLVLTHARTLAEYDNAAGAADLCILALEMLETTDLPAGDRKEKEKDIRSLLERSQFNALAAKAATLAEAKNYSEAAAVYTQAFDMNLIKATHHVRIAAVPVFAQAGDKESAFKQLELLTNTFKLGGNGSFIDNPLCAPLHSDPRWEKYMTRLEKNGNLYSR